MKMPLVSFRPMPEVGPLAVRWHAEGPFGEPVRARTGNGVGWFFPGGELLGVEFARVDARDDCQALWFSTGDVVEARVSQGRVVVRRSRMVGRAHAA